MVSKNTVMRWRRDRSADTSVQKNINKHTQNTNTNTTNTKSMSSFMSSLFGRSKKEAAAQAYANKINQVQIALTHLREGIVNLDKRQRFLEKRVASIVNEAREKLKAKDKEGAKLCIKRKALWTKQLANIGGRKFALESQIAQIEEAALNQTVFAAIERAAHTLQALQDRLPVERVERLLEASAEAVERAGEVTGAMNELTDAQADAAGIDEAELEAELDALMSEGSQPAAAATKATKATKEAAEADVAEAAELAELARQLEGLPRVPDATPAVADADAELAELAELEALEAEMISA